MQQYSTIIGSDPPRAAICRHRSVDHLFSKSTLLNHRIPRRWDAHRRFHDARPAPSAANAPRSKKQNKRRHIVLYCTVQLTKVVVFHIMWRFLFCPLLLPLCPLPLLALLTTDDANKANYPLQHTVPLTHILHCNSPPVTSQIHPTAPCPVQCVMQHQCLINSSPSRGVSGSRKRNECSQPFLSLRHKAGQNSLSLPSLYRRGAALIQEAAPVVIPRSLCRLAGRPLFRMRHFH